MGNWCLIVEASTPWRDALIRKWPTHARLAVLLGCSAAFATAGWCDSTTSTSESLAEQLWVPDFRLGSCGGSYSVESVSPEPAPENVEDEVRVFADEATLNLDGSGKVEGNVVVQRGSDRLEAPSITLNASNRELHTPQGALVVNENVALNVAQSDIRVSERRMNVANAEFVLLQQGIRGTAGLVKAGDGKVEFENALVTRCPPTVNSWSLSTRRFRLNRDQEIAEAWRAKLSLGSVPILYIPYVRFPTTAKRTSGVLLPELESNSLHGYELGVPVYLNLAPNFDLTLTPRLSTRGSHNLETEFRHMNQRSETSLKGVVLPFDGEYQSYVARLLRSSLPFDERDDERWLVEIQQEALFGNWEAEATYFVVSDTDFYRDFGESLGELRHIGLSRSLRIGRWSRNLGIAFNTERYDPFREWGSSVARVPEVAVDGHYRLGPFEAEFGFSSTRMERDRSDNVETSHRSIANLALSVPANRAWGHGVFRIEQSFARFETANDSSYDRNGTTALIDAGLFLEKGRRSSLSGYQTLEPRVVYVHRTQSQEIGIPTFDFGPTSATIDSLVDPSRVIGFDRIDDLEVLSLSTIARFFAPNSVGQKYAFQAVASYPRQVSRSNADSEVGLGIEFEATVNNELSVAGFHLIHPDRWTSQATGATIRYSRPDLQLVGQLRHQQPNDIVQSFASATIDFDNAWKVFSQWHYDWQHDRHIESFVGFEYAGCCITYRLLWRKRLRFGFADWEELRSRSGIHFELSLNGLTSIGDNILSIVERGRGLMGLSKRPANY